MTFKIEWSWNFATIVDLSLSKHDACFVFFNDSSLRWVYEVAFLVREVKSLISVSALAISNHNDVSFLVSIEFT